jgi:hypothetical protein
MGMKQILFDGRQIGAQADFFVLDAQIRPDIVPVEIDRALRRVHGFRDLLGGLALLNEACNLELRMRKPQKLG